MPDISMCRNNKCKLKSDCYRFNAIPNPWRQSYANFTPKEDGTCDNYYQRNTHKARKGEL